MASFDFSALSPDLIIDGIESAGFSVDSGLLALNSYENRVYQFHDDNLVKYVTKFYRPQRWQLKQILEEHDFSFELAEQELPIVAPLKVNGQSLFE
ncbi:MAG: Ser/Thr protein kinase RdoA (MazF antagonist), partial [Colwellia sp.]